MCIIANCWVRLGKTRLDLPFLALSGTIANASVNEMELCDDYVGFEVSEEVYVRGYQTSAISL